MKFFLVIQIWVSYEVLLRVIFEAKTSTDITWYSPVVLY
jgi:hypothetical protein